MNEVNPASMPYKAFNEAVFLPFLQLFGGFLSTVNFQVPVERIYTAGHSWKCRVRRAPVEMCPEPAFPRVPFRAPVERKLPGLLVTLPPGGGQGCLWQHPRKSGSRGKGFHPFHV